MTYDDIREVLPSISAACMYYAYGKLDKLQKLGLEEATDDFYMMYYELLDASADFVCSDYNEYYNTSRWYFSFKSMMEYYRLGMNALLAWYDWVADEYNIGVSINDFGFVVYE